jgi:bifunctional DNA-binding transcriptional regulator/antitoxin component of YhaV-PrlF toxin-antitoxin module
MAFRSPIALLSIAQDGSVTLPAAFRKDCALTKGGKLMVVRMGDALVMVPHDGVLEAICMRFEEALHGAGVSLEGIKAQALKERAQMTRTRYGRLLSQPKSKRRK